MLLGNRYELQGKLGEGGMGIVYRALDRLTGETVALKKVRVPAVLRQLAPQKPPADRRSRFKAASPAASTYEMRTRLMLAREFQVLASLRHPHIISVLDYGFDTDSSPFFTMTMLEKAANLREAASTLSVTDKAHLLIQVLQALAYLHRRGIQHRDLKPGNILVTTAFPSARGESAAELWVRVVDFGLAGAATIQGLGQGGTLTYMAPELFSGHTASPASDLYSVGVIAYELFTGLHPFATDDPNRMIEDILGRAPDLSRFVASPPTQLFDDDPTRLLDVDFADSFPATSRPPIVQSDPAPWPAGSQMLNQLAAITGRLLAKDPQDRYADAEAVIEALSRAIKQPVPVETSAIRESFLQAATFVGREAELEKLQAVLQRIIAVEDEVSGGGTLEAATTFTTTAGDPRRTTDSLAPPAIGSTWLIGGESGVGKSRLLEEIRIRALVEGVLVVRGQAVRDGGQLYQAWYDVIRRLVLSVEVTDREARHLKQLVPDLESLIERTVLGNMGDEWVTPASLAEILLNIIARQMEPLVLILEDIHWEPESLALLKQLIPRLASLPVLLLISYRDDEKPDMPEVLSSTEVIHLPRLSGQHIAALSQSMLGDYGTRPGVLEFLQRETEGNVFFLVEVVRALAEEAGGLDEIGSMKLPDRMTPGGMQTFIERRLDRIPVEARPLLALAAVAGRQLDLNLLRYINTTSIANEAESAERFFTLDAWLVTCASAAILEVHDQQWRFAHDKLRDGVLQTLSQAEKSSLHRRVAETLETLYPRHPAHYAALAFHWSQAGDAGKEVLYCRRMADRAVNSSAIPQAIEYLNRALELLESDPATTDLRQRVIVYYLYGDVYRIQGMMSDAERYYRSALELAHQLQDRKGVVRSSLGLAALFLIRGMFEAASTYYQDISGFAREINDEKSLARALLGLAHVAHETANYDEALQNYHQALEMLRQQNDIPRIVRVLNNLGSIARSTGNFAAAREHYDESLALARRFESQQNVALTLQNLAVVCSLQGQTDLAYSYAEESLAIYRTLGDVRGMANALNSLGNHYKRDRRYAEARQHYEEALHIFRQTGDRPSSGRVLNNLGSMAAAEGDYTAAEAYIEQSMEIAQAVGNRRGVVISLLNLTEMSIEQHDIKTASARLKEVLLAASELRLQPEALQAVLLASRIVAIKGEGVRATALLGLVLSHPSSMQGTRVDAVQHQANLQNLLSPETIKMVMQTGQGLNLDETIAALLEYLNLDS